MASDALVARLEQLAGVVRRLSREAFVAEPVPGVSGSIGAHVRHVLDHVAAFVAAGPSETLCYDQRVRGTAIERDADAALRRIGELQAALQGLGDRSLDEPIEVSALVAAGQPPVVGWSTRGRELAFVVSHTVHHQAIVAMLIAARGASTPVRFGYAPSTPSTPAAATTGAIQPCAR